MEIKTHKLNYQLVPHGTESTDLLFFNNTKDLFNHFLSNHENNNQLIICTDTNVQKLSEVHSFLSLCEEKNIPTVIIQSGEQYKSFDSVMKIIETALKNAFTRNCTFIAIGGGVISDITALASSLFKRGAKLEIIPTTLLSMVDASIGGKTACDYNNYKNMIGTFYPASKIYFSSQMVLSLSENDYFSGLAEAIKTAMLYSKDLFNQFVNFSKDINSRNIDQLSSIINTCSLAKAKIVEQDLAEKNIRKQLNLGHTFAHALETVAGFENITHGNAVAWGLSRAIELSYHLKLCTKEYRDAVFSLLTLYRYEISPTHPLLENISDYKKKIILAMKQDKKNTDDKILFVLQKDIQNTVFVTATEAEILSVI